jgi:hypothetical protein
VGPFPSRQLSDSQANPFTETIRIGNGVTDQPQDNLIWLLRASSEIFSSTMCAGRAM